MVQETSNTIDVSTTVEITMENTEDLEKVEKKEAKILVAIPCQEMVNVNFVTSLMGLQRPSGSKVVFTQSSILPQSRDSLANIAITEGYTHILFIDSDMTFPSTALHTLFMHNVDICTGLCFARKDIHNPCIYKEINYDNPVKGVHNGNIKVEEDIDRDFFEIKACGMAFCLIKVPALLDIRNQNDGELFRYIDTFGEDLSFCIRALKAGYKLYCDTTIPIGHVGEKIFGKQDWLMEKAIRAAKKKAQEEAANAQDINIQIEPMPIAEDKSEEETTSESEE